MTREQIITGLNTLSIRLSALGLRLEDEGIQSIRSAIEVLVQDDKPSTASQVWLVTAKNGDSLAEIPLLFDGNLLEATTVAIKRVSQMIEPYHVESVRRIGVGVEVRR